MSGRFSRPKDKADLLDELVGDESPFSEYRDALFFASVVGWREERRVPLAGRGEAIRWDVMTNRFATEDVVDMIAAAEEPDDKDLLSADRSNDRIAILEEYANGGLEVIQERLAARGAVPLRTVMIEIVQDYLDDGESEEHQDLKSRILNL